MIKENKKEEKKLFWLCIMNLMENVNSNNNKNDEYDGSQQSSHEHKYIE